jgi:predicted PurR-regulated permease PerM
MRDLLRTTAVILATVAVLMLLWSFRQVCVLLLIGITLATLTAPAIEYLVRRKISRTLATMIVYGAATVTIVLSLLIIADPLLRDMNQVVEDVAELHRYVDQNWRAGNGFQRSTVQWLPPFDEPLQPVAAMERDSLLRGVLGMGGGLFGPLRR